MSACSISDIPLAFIWAVTAYVAAVSCYAVHLWWSIERDAKAFDREIEAQSFLYRREPYL